MPNVIAKIRNLLALVCVVEVGAPIAWESSSWDNRSTVSKVRVIYPDSLKSREKFLAFCGSEDSDGA